MSGTRTTSPRIAPAAGAALLAAALSACSMPHGAVPAAGLEPCRLEGLPQAARCGMVERAENPADPASRHITVHFAVLPAIARGKEPDPLIAIAGGPGQSAMRLAGQLGPLFAAINRTRDLVLIDQRGTGRSNALECDFEKAFEGRSRLAQAVDSARQVELLRECAAKVPGDARHYHTAIAVQDFEAVREALGAPRVNLWGGSYGTRAALEYLRQFPDRVRTVVLDGVAPAGMKLPVSLALDADRALEALLSDCERDRACAGAYPGLREDVRRLMAEGLPAPLPLRDPVTGTQESLTITRAMVLAAIRAPLYAPANAAHVPLAIAAAARGDPGPLAALASLMTFLADEGFATGMHFAVVCAEDMPRVGAQEVERARATRIGTQVLDFYRDVCGAWASGTPPPGFYAPPRSEVPVLVLSGAVDPATPPGHAESILAGLPNARHVVVPNAGHIVSGQACLPEAIAQFVRTADARGLDVACVERIPRPTFGLPAAPEPAPAGVAK